MKTRTVVVLRGSVRERLETLAEHYAIDPATMWSMTVMEFAERVQAVRDRGGQS